MAAARGPASPAPPSGTNKTETKVPSADDTTAGGLRAITPIRHPKSGAKPGNYAFICLMGEGKFEVSVLPEKPIAIGRDEANDIVVDDEPISKRHARLTFSNNEMTLWDVGSKNGTFVNTERVTNRKLAPGDVITLGKAHLVFARIAKADGTLAGQLVPPGAEAGAQAIFAGKAGFRSGEKFYLSKTPLLIGREKFNSIAIADPSVSPYHALIARTADGVKIQDLASGPGVVVNGEKVLQAQLEPDDTVTLGSASFYCEEILGKRGTGTPKKGAAGQKEAGLSTIISNVLGQEHQAKPAGLGAELLKELEEKAVDLSPAPPQRAPVVLRITCIAGPIKGKSFPIGKRTLTVGRNPSSDIFLEDLSVSRDHAVIRAAQGRAVIEDKGSRNGVEVNGKRVPLKELTLNDRIAIGKCLFVIEPQEE
jgi:pSer/pThr/pTyr-binding forkhead associated (FHA) protein